MENRSCAQMRTRVDGLDLMKAAGILMVLSLHVPLWNYDFFEIRSFGRVIQYAFRLVSEGVPLFVMVNGYLLFRRKSLDMKKHLLKVLRMFALLLAWCVILTVFGSLLERNPQSLTLRSIIDHILWTQVGSQYTGPYWFLQNLLAIYLVYPVLYKLYRSGDRLFDYLFIVVFGFTVGINILEWIRDYLGTYVDNAVLTELIDFLYRFNPIGNAWYMLYFMLGGMVLKYQDRLVKKRMLLSIVGILSWLCAFIYGYTLSLRLGWVHNPALNYSSLTMVLFLIGFFEIVYPYQNRGGMLQEFAASVGRNTLGIYLTHFLFIFLVNRFFFLDSALKRALAFVFVFFASHYFSLLIKRIPGLRQLMNIG